jgi:hypothetical protein
MEQSDLLRAALDLRAARHNLFDLLERELHGQTNVLPLFTLLATTHTQLCGANINPFAR